MENYASRGHIDFPLALPTDGNNQAFPGGMLKFRNINPEQYAQDCLVWSQHKESLCCFPSQLFWNSDCCRLSSASKSAITTGEGWPASAK